MIGVGVGLNFIMNNVVSAIIDYIYTNGVFADMTKADRVYEDTAYQNPVSETRTPV